MKKYFNGERYTAVYCDVCQKDLENIKYLDKNGRYIDDDCLHGICKVCKHNLLKNCK